MYETPEPISKNKKIEIICLIVLLLWIVIFIINYYLYTKSKPLILAVNITRAYDDGYVKESISLGYVYRVYSRNSIKRDEFVPFWVLLENPESEPDLPKAATGYSIPDNPRRLGKYRGLLYYYTLKGELLGTYKCLNSMSDCDKAFGGHDKYDLLSRDPLTKIDKPYTLDHFYDKLAFIDDSYEQDSKYGDLKYSRTIYLYRFTEGEEEILAQFADIKASTYNPDREVAGGDGYKFIVKHKDNGKWGVINLKEDGSYDEVMPFEYDSITYDEDTKYYIICKGNSWYVYDLYNKQQVSVESSYPIYDVWRNDNLTYYFKTGMERVTGSKTYIDYKVYRLDGHEFLNVPHVIEVVERDTYIFYMSQDDLKLHFMDYSGTDRYQVKLYFSELEYDFTVNPSFQIFYEKSDFITLRVYKGREKQYGFDTVTVNVKHWEYND